MTNILSNLTPVPEDHSGIDDKKGGVRVPMKGSLNKIQKFQFSKKFFKLLLNISPDLWKKSICIKNDLNFFDRPRKMHV